MPDEKTYGFNRDDATAILAVVGGTESEYPESRPRQPSRGQRLAKTGTAIPARTTTTAGSGTVTLQKLVGTTITAETGTVTAYNFVGDEIAAAVYVWISRDERGNWWVTAEDCSGVA